MTPIQEAKQSADIVSVVSQYVALKKQGSEHVGLCPFHNDTHASLTVVPSKQMFYCHACGAGDGGADVVDFVAKIEGIPLVQAARKILGQDHPARPEVTQTERKELTPPTSKPPIPEDVTGAWEYTPSFWVIRQDTPEGKRIRPLMHGVNGWVYGSPSKPRPFYEVGEGELIICEGEKTVDALARMGYRARTWQGGANGWHLSDWSDLPNNVLMFRDNDWQGWGAMQSIALSVGVSPRFVTAPNRPKGWDAADEELTELPPLTTLDDLHTVHDPITGEAVRWIKNDGGKFKLTEDPPEPVRPIGYRALGFETAGNKSMYYFYSYGKNKVLMITASGFSKPTLFDLYPDVYYWETNYPGSNGGINVDMAMCALIEECREAGLYDPDKVRMRGAWVDRGRVVLHVGPFLIVDGKRTEINGIDSRFVYEWRKELDYEPGTPITSDQGATFIDMLSLYNWERDVNAFLLAGWCFIAPLCGALKWRPHIWVTGSSGTGKTKLMKDTVTPLMESIALSAEGETTEAGIRQRLDGDALPVLFDEAEAETRRAQERMEGILNLMRSSSSGKSGEVIKGGAGHVAKSFYIRSCFGFASIVYQASKKADRSRITVLGLVRNDDQRKQRERWDEYNRKAIELIDDGFIKGFHARAIKYLRQILECHDVFSRAVAEKLSDRRLGDQIGGMLAGAWMLRSDYVASPQEAAAWVNGFNWDEEKNLEELDDEQQLIRKLLQRRVRVDGEVRTVERNIGELIRLEDDVIPTAEAVAVLKRCGFDVEDGYLYVANNSEWITSALRDTPWAKNHGKILRRIQGAESGGQRYFATGLNSRSVKIPLDVIGY